MCLFCNWTGALNNTGFPASRRQVLRGAGAFVATAVTAPSLTLAAETPKLQRTPPTPKDGAADWLFQNGMIHTVNAAQPTAEAVAVRDTHIVYVGDKAGTAAWKGPNTKVVELSGRMLMP